MFGADAVEHLGGVEGAGNRAGPAFAPQHPAQQHRENLVRVHKVAVLVRCANAIGIAVCAEPGVAMVGDYGFAQCSDVRLNRSGLIPGKSGSTFPRICTCSTPMRSKIVERIVRPAPNIESMPNFLPDLAIRSRSAKLSMAAR